jgi:hypothetical protein
MALGQLNWKTKLVDFFQIKKKSKNKNVHGHAGIVNVNNFFLQKHV